MNVKEFIEALRESTNYKGNYATISLDDGRILCMDDKQVLYKYIPVEREDLRNLDTPEEVINRLTNAFKDYNNEQ